MDFEKENSLENENEQTNEGFAVNEDIFSSSQEKDHQEPEYTSSDDADLQGHQDGFSFEQSNPSGEYRIPNPKQDSEYEASEAEHTQYNPYKASAPGNGGYNSYSSSNYSNPQPPKKPSSNKGKKVLAVLLVLFIVIGSMGMGIAIGRNGGSHSQPDVSDTSSSTVDSAQIEVDTTKESNTASPVVSPGTVVAETARDCVVGVVAYDSRGTLYGEGSGVVMGKNKSGSLTYIITCAHVISASTIASYGILLEDGTVYDAKMRGYAERTDLGVLSIEETNLKAATFGDSTALKVGEAVYAIGNPGGSSFYGSVTDGIVSALDRSITSTYTMKVIQHTASINPGNSGGALVNSSGQVIGINSSKIAATDYEGIGFAVPMETAKSIVESIISYGYVPNRPKLGISYASVSDYQAYSMVVQIKGLPSGSVIIAGISDDSSLKGTKVEVGDMIIGVNGKKMKSSDVLLDIIDNAKVGDEIELEICRIDARTYKTSTFKVTAKIVEEKPDTQKKEEETTTKSYYDYYGDNDQFGGYSDFEDFFNHFFGN